jgi:glycosyltransferase involved in cell wall biosynthesis
MRVDVVDPSAFTPPYDHALCTALARAGADVELITSRFPYGSVLAPDGYRRRVSFYRRARGPAASRRRRATKLVQHVPDMLRYRRAALGADVVHFQWLDLQWLDHLLLPARPVVLTAHDLLPREPRPGQIRAQRRLYDAVDAVVVHSGYGRDRLVRALGVDPRKVHVIHHGAFAHLTRQPREQPLPDELQRVRVPVVLFFGLLRPYKGLDVLLAAWRRVEGAELWIVGRPRMEIESLRANAPEGVRFMTRFVSDGELPAYFRRADMVVLPYSRTERFDQSGVLATALAFAKPTVLSDLGGFSEVAAHGAAALVPAGDPAALAETLTRLLADPAQRERLAAAAAVVAAGPYSWDRAARRTLELYRQLLTARGAAPAPQSTPL